MIPYGRQDITEADIGAVIDVLRSEFVTQGPIIENFEKDVAAKVGANYGIAINSATSGLHIGCMALGLKEGDILWTSPNSFVASANCGLYCGATVGFVDIDPKTYNISIPELTKKCEQADKNGTLPKVLVVVHFSGEPCDMEAIGALATKYGFSVIEDASHAIGGKYANEMIGRCSHSDLCIFSFHPVKIITTGEGGMVTTNDSALAEKLRMFRTHGITKERDNFLTSEQGAWYYEQQSLGMNYRMTDIQAALGKSQLKRLDGYVATRQIIAQRYDGMLSSINVITPFRDSLNLSSCHLYVILVEPQRRRDCFEYLRNNGIGVNVHYIPIHLQPYYQSIGFQKGHFPNAEAYYERCISLPIYPTLTIEQQKYVSEKIACFLYE